MNVINFSSYKEFTIVSNHNNTEAFEFCMKIKEFLISSGFEYKGFVSSTGIAGGNGIPEIHPSIKEFPNVPLIDNFRLIFQQGNSIVSFFRNQLRKLCTLGKYQILLLRILKVFTLCFYQKLLKPLAIISYQKGKGFYLVSLAQLLVLHVMFGSIHWRT